MDQILFKIIFSVIGILAILVWGIIRSFGKKKGLSRTVKGNISKKKESRICYYTDCILATVNFHRLYVPGFN